MLSLFLCESLRFKLPLMPSDAWPLESPMLPPLVLRPPHGPRLVRLLVVILAAMFHLATAGWSLITNGPEGELARAAQDLWVHGGWTATAPVAGLDGPLALWMTRLSFGILGPSDFAARLPTALAAIVMVWFTLRLAERFGGIWRGFVAALILICSPGMFTLGRVLTPFPLTAAWIAAAFCFLEFGWTAHPLPTRRRWLGLAWIAWGGSVLSGGWIAAGVIPLAVVLLSLFYREARMRFRALLSWEGAVALTLTVAVMTAAGFPPGAARWSVSPEWTHRVYWQAGLLFPWSLLLLPAAANTLWRLARWQPLEWNEAFPLAWAASGAVLALAAPSFFFPLLFWPAFAVWAATELATLHRKSFLRWSGLVVVAAASGLFLIAHLRAWLPLVFPEKAPVFAAIPDFFWFAVTPVAFIALLAFLLFGTAALWAEFMHNRRFALLAFFAAMIPAGFAFADIGAKFAPYFSDSGLARCIRSHVGPERPVVLSDLDRAQMSSLLFYLGPENDVQTPPRALWTPPFFFVTERGRLPYWKENLPGAVEVECTGGEHLLLSVRL